MFVSLFVYFLWSNYFTNLIDWFDQFICFLLTIICHIAKRILVHSCSTHRFKMWKWQRKELCINACDGRIMILYRKYFGKQQSEDKLLFWFSLIKSKTFHCGWHFVLLKWLSLSLYDKNQICLWLFYFKQATHFWTNCCLCNAWKRTWTSCF